MTKGRFFGTRRAWRSAGVLTAPGLVLVFFAVPGEKCSSPASPAPSSTTAAAAPTPAPVLPPPPRVVAAPTPDAFTASIRPILAAHCAPCHEPGGQMYERLPFDRAEVVGAHPEGVLKRLKGDDRATVERWFASMK